VIFIPHRVLDAIITHARAKAPNECCGLLVGHGEKVDEAVPTRNLRQSPTGFQIDPTDHFAALRQTRAERREILGAYHSHPRSAAAPSATDVAEAHYPEFLYLIVSLADATPDVRGYHIRSGAVEAVPFETVRDGGG
jgi:proteasome lid subunit RPN8/RPN11